MRLDTKYFNRFILICGAIGFIAITFFTLRHSFNRISDYEKRLSQTDFNDLKFKTFADGDSLSLQQFRGNPVLIHFWSTWSPRSLEVSNFLERNLHHYPDLIVLAASVRDDSTLASTHIYESNYSFYHVVGTEFYQSILVPGMPSQIMLFETGELAGYQVGGDTLSLEFTLNELFGSADE